MIRSSRFLQPLAIFIVGIIVGSALFSGIYHHHFNELLVINANLAEQLKKIQADLRLEEENKNKTKIIKSVNVRIEDTEPERKLDDMTKTEIRQRVEQDLAIFRGRSVAQITTQLEVARQMLNRKIYPDIQEKDYVIRVTMALVMNTELTFWIEAHVFSDEGR